MKIENKSLLRILDNFGYPVDYKKLWIPQIFIGGISCDHWLEEGGKTEIDIYSRK